MTTLVESALRIANDPEPASLVKFLDQYIVLFLKDPERFVLPVEHAWMAPILETYAYDTEAYVKYLTYVRNLTPQPEYKAIHRAEKDIRTRMLMRVRRQRAERAIEKAVEKHGDYPDYETRVRWIAHCERQWSLAREQYMKKARAASGGSLTREAQAEHNAEFFRSLDQRIERGDVPPWSVIDGSQSSP